jgi:hypothetical protein
VSDIRGYKSFEKWLNNVKPSTSEPYRHFLRRIYEYAKLDSGALLESAKSDREAVWWKVHQHHQSSPTLPIFWRSFSKSASLQRQFLR